MAWSQASIVLRDRGSSESGLPTIQNKKGKLRLSLNILSPGRIAEAAEAYGRLKPYNIELLDAVNAYTEAHKQRIARSELETPQANLSRAMQWLNLS